MAWNAGYLFLLKSTLRRWAILMSCPFTVFVLAPSYGVGFSSCEENEADEDSLDLRCMDSSLCFWCLRCNTYSCSSVSLSWSLSLATCYWLDYFFS